MKSLQKFINESLENSTLQNVNVKYNVEILKDLNLKLPVALMNGVLIYDTKTLKYIDTKEEKLETIIEHIELEVEEKGENVGIKELRKHMCLRLLNLTTLKKI